MNKLLLFLVLLLSTAMPVIYAATPDVIVKKVNFHYDLDDFSILIKEGTVEVRPASFSSAFPEGGEPAIPVFRTRLEVPSCSFCHIDTIQSENWVMVAENVQLLEEGYPLIGSSKNLPVRKVYENHEPIVPMQQVRIATLNNHLDNGVILLETYPFIYDTSTHSIYFTPDITVVISILVSDIAGKISHQATVSLEELTIDQDGSNGDQLDPLKLGGGYDILPDPIYPDPVDYVIITNKKLAPHFQKLLEWKRQKGLHAEILTIDDLGSIDYPEELARSIKSWLDQNRQERGLAYALIGGDVNIVPAVNCYAPVKTGVDTYYSPGIPTDLYYACHKGNLNWDKNSNGKKGEADDDIEFHQDILVSRIPVFNQETVEIVTEKIIDYEKNGKVNMSLLQTGSELFGEVAEGIPDAQLIALTLYNQSIAPYWNGTRTEVFNSLILQHPINQ